MTTPKTWIRWNCLLLPLRVAVTLYVKYLARQEGLRDGGESRGKVGMVKGERVKHTELLLTRRENLIIYILNNKKKSTYFGGDERGWKQPPPRNFYMHTSITGPFSVIYWFHSSSTDQKRTSQDSITYIKKQKKTPKEYYTTIKIQQWERKINTKNIYKIKNPLKILHRNAHK